MRLSSDGTTFTQLATTIYTLSSLTADNANATTLPTLTVTASYASGTAASLSIYIEYKDNSRKNTGTDTTGSVVANVQW